MDTWRGGQKVELDLNSKSEHVVVGEGVGVAGSGRGRKGRVGGSLDAGFVRRCIREL